MKPCGQAPGDAYEKTFKLFPRQLIVIKEWSRASVWRKRKPRNRLQLLQVFITEALLHFVLFASIYICKGKKKKGNSTDENIIK